MKIIQISTISFGGQSSNYQCFGLVYALTDTGKIFWRREGCNDTWTEEAPLEVLQQPTTQPVPQLPEATPVVSTSCGTGT